MTFKEAQDKALDLFWKIRPQAQERNLDVSIQFSESGTSYGGVVDYSYESIDITVCYFTQNEDGSRKCNFILSFFITDHSTEEHIADRLVELENNLKKEGFVL